MPILPQLATFSVKKQLFYSGKEVFTKSVQFRVSETPPRTRVRSKLYLVESGQAGSPCNGWGSLVYLSIRPIPKWIFHKSTSDRVEHFGPIKTSTPSFFQMSMLHTLSQSPDTLRRKLITVACICYFILLVTPRGLWTYMRAGRLFDWQPQLPACSFVLLVKNCGVKQLLMVHMNWLYITYVSDGGKILIGTLWFAAWMCSKSDIKMCSLLSCVVFWCLWSPTSITGEI